MTEPKQSFTEEVQKEAEGTNNPYFTDSSDRPFIWEKAFKAGAQSALSILSRKSEGREFWIGYPDAENPVILQDDERTDGDGSFKVIEHSALVAERARNAELEEKLQNENSMLMLQSQARMNRALEAESENAALKTELAVEKECHEKSAGLAIQRHTELTTLRAQVEELKQYQLIAGEYAEEIQAIKTTLATMEEQRNNLVDEVGSGKMWSESTVKYQISKLDLELQKKGQGE